MSYAVCRMAKMKSHSLKGIQFHNQREKESKTNPDIDKTKTHLNYDLVNDQMIDYNKRVKEIIDSQKTSTRKTRKDAVLVNELLVTSDRDFFDKLPADEQKRFFEESYKLFSDRYGEHNIAYATVHNDEKTPHMHIGVVPMRDGKLQGKNVFNQKELRWIQDEFPKHLKSKEFEIERGEKGSDAKHLKVQDYKAKTLEEKINTLESELTEKQGEKEEIDESIQRIQTELKELNDASTYIKQIDTINFKEKGILGRKTVNLERSDFDNLKTLAKASESLKIENKAISEQNTKLKESNKKLSNENKDLKKQNKTLQQDNKFLKRTLEQVKVHFKDQVKEINTKIGFIKGNILDKMGLKLLKTKFDNKEEIQGGLAFLHSKKQMEKEQQKEKGMDELEL